MSRSTVIDATRAFFAKRVVDSRRTLSTEAKRVVARSAAMRALRGTVASNPTTFTDPPPAAA